MLQLLTVDPKERLGYNDDANAIKAHPFFAGIDWDRLLAKEVTPPFIPKVVRVSLSLSLRVCLCSVSHHPCMLSC